jgi:hypothetical protein
MTFVSGTDSSRNPDPIVTANIYADGLLDEVMARVVLPLTQKLNGGTPRDDTMVWIVRYSRNGEHLKVRLHGKNEEREKLRAMLAESAEAYLEAARELPPVSTRVSRMDAPAIDPEDEGYDDQPDRTLLWTTYRRTHITLGGMPWLADSDYAARAYDCLSAACGLALLTMKPGEKVPSAVKQKTLIGSLLSGLAGVLHAGISQSPEPYLQYHRDWLLRFFLDETEKEQRALEQFTILAQRQPETLRQLHLMAAQHWSGAREPEGTSWARSITELAAYTRQYSGRREYRIDPFTDNMSFPPLFKAFHSLANQLGLLPLEEAYVYHLLLSAVEAPQHRPELAAARSAL